ncbi:MAG: class I SAM-dependent methyltransferase [Pseudomonadota bacterium]
MKHWDVYWQDNGSMDSFGDISQSFTEHSTIRAAWEPLLKKVNNDSSIVDIGSGNGALALFIADYCQQQGLSPSIAAVDLATLDLKAVARQRPAVAPLVDTITVYQQTSATDMPFADGSVTDVVSQFGFEYMPLQQTLVEVFRVLEPGGRFAALIHHQQSSVTQDSQVGIKVLNKALNESELFTLAEQYLTSTGEHQQAFKQQLKQCMNQLLSEFGEQGQAWSIDVTKRLAQLFQQQQLSVKQRVATLHHIRQLLTYSKLRSEAQVASAMDESAINQLIEMAQNKGFDCQQQDKVIIEERPIGWHLVLQR